jgi:methylated-DNA-[protein]-cysteine S-methyltransferase
MNYSVWESPIGKIGITTDDHFVLGIDLCAKHLPDPKSTPVAQKTIQELKEYFSGNRKNFTLDFPIRGTPFQQEVLRAMMRIPYGTTVSYAELAKMAGKPRAYRAVGTVCATNEIPLLIPCHRVIKSDGTVGNFAVSPKIKQQIIDLEKAHK